MSNKYKAIFKLKRMLEKDGIPFEFIEGFGYDKSLKTIYPDLLDYYQICYPVFDPEKRIISVIEGFGTHGAEQDKLEIMGLLTPWERYHHGDSVIGWLTVNNVYKRIKKDWEENKDERISVTKQSRK